MSGYLLFSLSGEEGVEKEMTRFHSFPPSKK